MNAVNNAVTPSRADQRRADRVAEREQARLDAAAAAKLRADERAQLAELAKEAQANREKARATRRARLGAAWTSATGWVAAHAAELLVYPLALVSAAMAVPAMAEFGYEIYGSIAGCALPVLSELGMWAFAFAVPASRRADPDRPTGMLTAGIGVFALIGAGLNFAHGLHDGVVNALVMAVVSVAGVAAHQLVAAGPRRSRAERTERRLARDADRRVAAARRLATRRAVVELGADGRAALVYAPGRYAPARRRLVRATVPGLPVAPPGDDWDAGLADLLAGGGQPGPAGSAVESADPTTGPDLAESAPESGAESGGVALADPPESAGPTPAADPTRRSVDPQARRTLTPGEALAAARRLARRQGRPVTATQLREALRVGAKAARELRDRVNTEIYGAGGAA